MRSTGYWRALAAFGLFALSAGPGAAQVATIGTGIDNIVSAFEGAVNGASANLLTAAKTLLGSLLLIELILTIGKIVVKGSDLGELFAALMQRILIAGFYLFLMDSLPGFGGMNGLVGASAEALAGLGSGGQAIKPSDILGQSLGTAAAIFGSASGFGETVSAAVSALVIVVLTAITVAMIVVAYVEIHVVFGLGIIALGFGGFSGTDGIARGYLMAGIAKALKLFAMLVLTSIFGSVFQSLGFGYAAAGGEGLSWEGAGDFMTHAFTLVAAAAVMMMVVLTVPAALEQAIAGANAGGATASGGTGSWARGKALGAGGKAMGMAGGVAGKVGGAVASAGWNASGGAKAASNMKARVNSALGRNS